MRDFYEMIPNWAVEKHAWLGAGLIWKRIHGSSTGERLQQQNQRTPEKKRMMSNLAHDFVQLAKSLWVLEAQLASQVRFPQTRQLRMRRSVVHRCARHELS